MGGSGKGGGWIEGLTNPFAYVLGGSRGKSDPLTHSLGSSVDKWLGTTGATYAKEQQKDRRNYNNTLTNAKTGTILTGNETEQSTKKQKPKPVKRKTIPNDMYKSLLASTDDDKGLT